MNSQLIRLGALLMGAVIQMPMATAQDGPRSLPGIAVAEHQVTMSAPFEGLLVAVMVEEGQVVQKGQPLAKLDDRVARAAVGAARVAFERQADIVHARAAVDLAQDKLRRLEKARDAVNAMTLAEARSHALQAQASLDSAMHARQQAQLNLELEQARLDCLTIRAPFDARVSRVMASEGVTMTTVHELLQLVALRRLRADVPVPISQFGKLQVGRLYELNAGAPVSRPLAARLVFVDPVLDPASGTFRASFRIDNVDESLPAGFAVRLASMKPVPEESPAAPPGGGGR